MKKIYLPLVYGLLAVGSMLSAQAAEWSYDWPIPATKDKDTGYANGFYNFSSSFDADLTQMDRTLDGRKWTLTFDADTQVAYTSSGQMVGSAVAGKGTWFFTLASDSFDGVIKSATIQLKTKATDATVGVTVGDVSYLCNDKVAENVTGDNEVHEYKFIPGENDGVKGTVSFRYDAPSANTANYIKLITIEYEERVAGVRSPILTPAPGIYDAPVEVSISGVEGSEILYTLDGSNPLAEDNAAAVIYDGPFTVSETTLVKCVTKKDGDASAVVEGRYNIRKEAGLSLLKESFEIELLEEDLILIDNPNNLSPITYSSSNSPVAWSDKYGHIYTYSLGEAVISVNFAGNDDFMPQTLTVPVKVVAKEPVEGFTVSPESGTYDGPLTVTVKCTDPRVETIWYNIGDTPSEVDDLGILQYGQYAIHEGTELTLTLDHDCVLSVQAMGLNLWSEAKFIDYKVVMPLKADFKADVDNYEVIYHQGFDSMDEAMTWDYSSGSEFAIVSRSPIEGVPDFSAINPESKSSLYHNYKNESSISIAASPVMTVPENAKLRFHMAFNPVWLYWGNILIYACENSDDAVPVEIWNANDAANEAATDDVKWNQYYVDLSDLTGKEVYFALAYDTGGDQMLLDDFEMVTALPESDVVNVVAGSSVSFMDLSTGNPDSWNWQLPGSSEGSSYDRNPIVTYNTPGTYDVTLTVTKGQESDTMVRSGYVVVTGSAPAAEIGLPERVYYSPEAGIVVPLDTPLTFTDKSKGGPVSWLWTLPGTDLKSAVTRNVTVKYENAGMYDVDLTVSNDYGNSSTYIYGVKAGGESLIWNIPTRYNEDLGMISLGWYGSYGGTNWLDMDAFAERFEAPLAPATVSGVNIYFAAVDHGNDTDELTVSLLIPGADGMPATELARTSLTLDKLVDASETYNDPTWFPFETPVDVNTPFFISVTGFPNGDSDNVVMYSLRREDGINTAYHLLKELDDNNQPTGETRWYSQEEDPTSFAIAPKIQFGAAPVGVAALDADNEETEVFNMQGMRMPKRNLERGIYIERRGSKVVKILK